MKNEFLLKNSGSHIGMVLETTEGLEVVELEEELLWSWCW
jgi:hypothetical protein